MESIPNRKADPCNDRVNNVSSGIIFTRYREMVIQ